MVEKAGIVLEIEKYLAKYSMTRLEFAERIGISLSAVEKVLSGNSIPSSKFIHKVAAKTGIDIEFRSAPSFDFDLQEHKRQYVTHVEGLYQTIRPSYRNPDNLNGFVTKIEWCEASRCLLFEEQGNDLAPHNKGYVSIPLYNRMIYLVSSDKGNFQLAILSDAYESGIYYGGLMTVSSLRMVDKMPTAAVFVLKRMTDGEEPVFGVIDEMHPRFIDFQNLLIFAREEGFFRSLC